MPRVALLAILTVLAVWLFTARARERMPDFEVYWRAGARAAAAEPLYRPSDGDYQFKYFPAFAVAMIPLGAMPLAAAKAVWFAVSVAALTALLPLSTVLLTERRKPAALLIAFVIAGLGKYYAEELVLGQINTLVALAGAGMVLAMQYRREALGGSLAALAIVLKPYALILVPWVLARRQPRAIAALAIGLAAAFAMPVLAYGVDGTFALHREWWRTVTATTDGVLLHTDNVSLASMWAKRLGAGSAATALAAVSSIALLVAVVMVFVRRNGVRRPDGLEAGLLLAITPLVSPQGWDYVAVLTTIVMIHVVNDVDRLPLPLRALIFAAIASVGLSLYDLLGRRALYLLLNLSVVTIGLLVLIAAAVMLRMRRLA